MTDTPQAIDPKQLIQDLISAVIATTDGAEAGVRIVDAFLRDLSGGRKPSIQQIIGLRQHCRAFLDAMAQQRDAMKALREGLK